MSLVRAYDGPPPSHPVRVVPDDPGRRGALVRVRGWEIAVADPVAQVGSLQGLAAAAQDLGWSAAGRSPEGPPFTDGLVGFLTDDVAAGLLDLPTVDVRPGPAPLPPLWFGDYTHAACQDPSGAWWLAGRTPRDLGRAAALLRDAASRPGGSTRPPPPDRHVAPAPIRTTIDQATHAAAVRRIQGWIAAGDVYQVNLTLHVAAPWDDSPRRLAHNLFGAGHGAAHAGYLHAPGATIISISPETFLRTDGSDAWVRPIKGTRRRSGDPAEDRLLAKELVAATKDAAEHVMIVDLERNDLGRISEVGSVTVPQLMTLEAHPTVWHLTSTVGGRLVPDVGFGQVISALFPCGSITGAPKRMAVDRIRQLEPWRRGVYCGAIGVITHGLVDLSVAIRTAVLHDDVAWYGTGGGIVADSDPHAEWDEAMAKAQPFFNAVSATNR